MEEHSSFTLHSLDSLLLTSQTMSYLRALVEAKENFITIIDVNEVFKFKLRWRFVDRALLSFKIQ